MGRGVLPLDMFLSILKDKGYEGVLSVEIFREEYWKQVPETIARDAKAALDKTLAGL